MHQVTRAINDADSWREGLRLTVQRLCESEGWQAGYVYLPDREDPDTLVPTVGYLRDQRLQAFHRATQQCRFTRGTGLPAVVYDDGRARWVSTRDDVLRQLPVRRDAAEQAGLQTVLALPIRSGSGVIGVLELISNERHAPNTLLVDLMNDIGVQIGKVLERDRSATEMADLVWREQQGLLHTLHDSLGQTLTGLGMLATGLARQPPGATVERATQIGELAQQAITQVRQLARGLFPLEIDAQSLMPALRELASTTKTFHGIDVTVEGGDASPVGDGRVATQLYRIAQESVTNAVKHANAGSITIALRSDPGVALLQVKDDGTGITGRKSEGLGLRIMMYRAVSIGAMLVIEPATAGGTTVTCTLPLSAKP
jgi:signal transduction histidine kinase